MASKENFANLTLTVGLYAILFISGMGIITNILNIRVCLGKKTRNTAMGFYNFITAIFYICYLTLVIFAPSLRNTYTWACILLPYAVRVFYQMTSWLNVMVSFDRLFLSYTYKPHHNVANKNLNKKKFSLIILGIFLILICVNVSGVFYHLETQQSTTESGQVVNTTLCVPDNSLVGIIRDTVAVVAHDVLPLILLVGTNVVLILKLKHLSQNVSNASMMLKRERRFAITITILNTIYAISYLLALTSTLLINIYGYNQTYVSSGSYESSLASFVYVCVQLLTTFINCDLAFIVNLLSHKTFRKEAIKIVLCKKD